MALPADVNGPSGLAVDPADPGRLFLAAWSRPVAGRPVGGGVFASDDGGKSWRHVLKRDQHRLRRHARPARPGTLYAAGSAPPPGSRSTAAAAGAPPAGFQLQVGPPGDSRPARIRPRFTSPPSAAASGTARCRATPRRSKTLSRPSSATTGRRAAVGILAGLPISASIRYNGTASRRARRASLFLCEPYPG